jgi:hypothetical protein
MIEPKEPTNVQIAERLGWTEVHETKGWFDDPYSGPDEITYWEGIAPGGWAEQQLPDWLGSNDAALELIEAGIDFVLSNPNSMGGDWEAIYGGYARYNPEPAVATALAWWAYVDSKEEGVRE